LVVTFTDPEASMNQPLPPFHPTLALRTYSLQLKALLAIAAIAVAVIVLAAYAGDRATTARPAATFNASAQTADTGAQLDHRGLNVPSRYHGPH
jgi:hypothetical protein